LARAILEYAAAKGIQPTAADEFRMIQCQTGVDEVLAELLPADKVTAIESLFTRYGPVAMVGDGVNDAPALGRATIGIAMGAAGSDAAIETADIALMSADLAKLPWLIRHSRRTVAVIRQNVAFSLAVKAIFVVLTFAGSSSFVGRHCSRHGRVAPRDLQWPATAEDSIPLLPRSAAATLAGKPGRTTDGRPSRYRSR